MADLELNRIRCPLGGTRARNRDWTLTNYIFARHPKSLQGKAEPLDLVGGALRDDTKNGCVARLLDSLRRRRSKPSIQMVETSAWAGCNAG